jgi:polyribonucleotide nucleotidyltransferase
MESDLDLVYVGNENDMMMIEGSADQSAGSRLHRRPRILPEGHPADHRRPAQGLAAMYSKTKRVFPLVVCEPKALAICERVSRRRRPAQEGDLPTPPRTNAATP